MLSRPRAVRGKQLEMINLPLVISRWPLAQCCTWSPILLLEDVASSLVGIGLFSPKTGTALSYCQMKTAKDDEHCPKVNAFKASFRRTGWGWNSTWGCCWVRPGLCRELLALAPGSHSQWRGVPCDANIYQRSAHRKMWPLKEKGM